MKKRIFLTPKCDECGHDEFEYDSSCAKCGCKDRTWS